MKLEKVPESPYCVLSIMISDNIRDHAVPLRPPLLQNVQSYLVLCAPALYNQVNRGECCGLGAIHGG